MSCLAMRLRSLVVRQAALQIQQLQRMCADLGIKGVQQGVNGIAKTAGDIEDQLLGHFLTARKNGNLKQMTVRRADLAC